jgi:hypothetical protein
MALLVWLLAQIDPQARIQGHHIEISGTTKLPDGASLTVEILSVGGELAREAAEVQKGRFFVQWLLPAKATYRVRVSFDLGSQGRIATVEKIKSEGLDKEFQWERELAFGTRDEQIEEFRRTCGKLEERVNDVVRGVEGFFSLMIDPPKDWEVSQRQAIEAIRDQANRPNAAARVFGLDDLARSAIPDLAHQAEEAILLRAKGERDGKLSAALEKASRVRQYAQTLRERLTPSILKKSEVEAMARRLESSNAEQAAPILLQLAHALGSKHYAAVAEIGEFLWSHDPRLKQALADLLASLE